MSGLLPRTAAPPRTSHRLSTAAAAAGNFMLRPRPTDGPTDRQTDGSSAKDHAVSRHARTRRTRHRKNRRSSSAGPWTSVKDGTARASCGCVPVFPPFDTSCPRAALVACFRFAARSALSSLFFFVCPGRARAGAFVRACTLLSGGRLLELDRAGQGWEEDSGGGGGGGGRGGVDEVKRHLNGCFL